MVAERVAVRLREGGRGRAARVYLWPTPARPFAHPQVVLANTVVPLRHPELVFKDPRSASCAAARGPAPRRSPPPLCRKEQVHGRSRHDKGENEEDGRRVRVVLRVCRLFRGLVGCHLAGPVVAHCSRPQRRRRYGNCLRRHGRGGLGCAGLQCFMNRRQDRRQHPRQHPRQSFRRRRPAGRLGRSSPFSSRVAGPSPRWSSASDRPRCSAETR